MAKQSYQPDYESDHDRDQRETKSDGEAKVAAAVRALIGTPPRFEKVIAHFLWPAHYRVNVYCWRPSDHENNGRILFIAESYWVDAEVSAADGTEIFESRPPIVRGKNVGKTTEMVA